jgi:hypothetical protein
LLFYDSFADGTSPAEVAAIRLGFDILALNYDTLLDAPADFAQNFDAGGWDLVIVDQGGNFMPTEVSSRMTSRANAGLPLIITYWDLEMETALLAALGVEATTYDAPVDVYAAESSPVDLFDGVETFPSPLVHIANFGDNGDFFTTPAGGSVLLAAGSPDGQAVGVMNSTGSTILLGFLMGDFAGLDADTDGVEDTVELFTNILSL